MRNLGAFVLCVWVGMATSVPGVSCVTTGVASIHMTNSSDCSGSLLLPSVNFTSSTITYASGPNGPYNMPMSLCTRVRTSTDSTSPNINTNAMDVQITCSPNGTWTLRAWAPRDVRLMINDGNTRARPVCDMDVQPATPIWIMSGTNNACVSANLTLWRGAAQGSLSVTCFPTAYVEEPAEQVGDKCRGATDCATVTLYSATSNDLSASCGAVSQSLIAPANGSCQPMVIGNMSYSYRVACTPGKDALYTANYDFRAWLGPTCGDPSSSIHVTGSSLSSLNHPDTNGLLVYDFYQLYSTTDSFCQPITFGQGQGADPTLPQRITVTCGGGVDNLGATVYAYDPAAITAPGEAGAGASALGCSRGLVRSVYVVSDIPPNYATLGIGNCHPSDFTQNSRTVFSEMIQCHPDGSFDVDLFTYDVDPTGQSLHCQPAYHNATIHGTSGQCINKPTLAGPPQPVRIICNGPHLIPNNTNTNGTGAATGTAGGGSGSGSGSATSSSNTNTNTASTSTTAGPSGSTSISTSSNSGSSSNSSTGSGSGSGSGSGNLPNGGVGFGSRYPCATVMMMAWVGAYLIF